MKRILLPILILFSSVAYADCSTDQTLCETQCALKHFSDEAAELGCKSRCLAKRAACSTESGAKTVVETGGEVIDDGVDITKEAWQDTKSFVRGLTEE